MAKYTLSYFNFRARAELARLLFAMAEVDYEDDRVRPEEWLARKPDTPFGQLPVLAVDGEQICQSNSIARYLARQFGFTGKSPLEEARADMIVECVDDMLYPIMPAYREKCDQKRAEMRRSYNDELPVFMELMEKLLSMNNDGEEYFVGDEVTWADLSVMNAWHWIPGFGVSVPIEKYPKLKAHKDRIEAIPQIAHWIETRPKTPV